MRLSLLYLYQELRERPEEQRRSFLRLHFFSDLPIASLELLHLVQAKRLDVLRWRTVPTSDTNKTSLMRRAELQATPPD